MPQLIPFHYVPGFIASPIESTLLHIINVFEHNYHKDIEKSWAECAAQLKAKYHEDIEKVELSVQLNPKVFMKNTVKLAD